MSPPEIEHLTSKFPRQPTELKTKRDFLIKCLLMKGSNLVTIFTRTLYLSIIFWIISESSSCLPWIKRSLSSSVNPISSACSESVRYQCCKFSSRSIKEINEWFYGMLIYTSRYFIILKFCVNRIQSFTFCRTTNMLAYLLCPSTFGYMHFMCSFPKYACNIWHQ